MTAELIGALAASAFGILTVLGKRTPLFYKIIFFAVLTCLMGNIYTALYNLLWQPDGTGFHVGYLGYLGMFFFLYSSYYGAINSLADGGQAEFRKFRLLAGLAAAVFFAGSVVLMYCSGKPAWMCIVVVPMAFTLYFATKLLIIPDVDMGIIRVMRLYNGWIIALCVAMILRILSEPGSMLEAVSSLCAGVLLALCLPVARNGVQKWFI